MIFCFVLKFVEVVVPYLGVSMIEIISCLLFCGHNLQQ